MIQKLKILTAFLFTTAICFAQKATILSGNFKGVDHGTKVYLSQLSKAGRIDSFTVTRDSFQFKLNIEQGDFYFLSFTSDSQSSIQDVYLQKGSDVHVMINKNFDRTLTKSKLADEQNGFRQGLINIVKRQSLHEKELINAKDSSLITKLKLEIEDIKKERQRYFEQWIKKHKDSPFSLAVLYLYMQDRPAAVLEELYSSLSPQAKENNLITDFMPYRIAEQKSKESFKIGEKLKDFVLKDTSGKAQSFYSLKGNNYVLLDFWASWCGPCRGSNPEIKKLLETYGQDNFRVISVSADTDHEKWKDAIVKDQMNWYHLSDLKGTESGFMFDNHIYAFPTYVLVSPEGIPILRPVDIERVNPVLEQIFGKKGDQKP